MSEHELSAQCRVMNAVLARVGDRWSVQIIFALGNGPMRFNALKRELGVTQRVLAQSLRDLEREGLVLRHQAEGLPPRVDYELTDLGRSFREPVRALAQWAIDNAKLIEERRLAVVDETCLEDEDSRI